MPGLAVYDPNKIINSLPTIDDSMANQVTALASKDSALNQMARTEGLKAANRRGLLNSSMAVGASQDAVLRNIMPIAGQDAQTAAAKNAAARAFEYGLTAQTQQQGWQTGEREAGQGFITSERLGSQAYGTSEREAGQVYGTSERLGSQAYGTSEREAGQVYGTSERLGSQAYGTSEREAGQGFQRGEREAGQEFITGERLGTQGFTTSERIGTQAWQSSEGEKGRVWSTGERIGTQAWQSSENALTNQLERDLQAGRITSAEKMGYAQMASTEGIAAASNKLQWDMLIKDWDFRVSEGSLDRAQATALQNDAQAYQAEQNKFTRDLEDKIATMNLTATQQAGLMSGVNNANLSYQAQLQTIMANPDLDAATRTQYLNAAKSHFQNYVGAAQTLYNIDVKWGGSAPSAPATGGATTYGPGPNEANSPTPDPPATRPATTTSRPSGSTIGNTSNNRERGRGGQGDR